MKTFTIEYLRFEIRRGMRMLPWFFGSILLLVGVVSAGALTIRLFLQKAQLFEVITVDLAIHEDETKVRQITELLSDMESVKNICRFQYVSPAKARADVEGGGADAAILVGERFYQDLENGRNTPATILFPRNTSVGQQMLRQLLTDGVSLVQTTEAAVYAASDARKAFNLTISKKEMEDLIFFTYLERAFFRGEIFQKRVISPTGEFAMMQYYFVGGLLVCIMMSGLNFGFLYQKQERLIEEKLRLYGIGCVKASLVKVTAMGWLLWLITAALLAVSGTVLSLAGVELYLVRAMVGMLPLCISMAAVFHLLYRYGGVRGGALVFLVNVGMMLGTGVLLPVRYLPDGLAAAGAVMPLTCWMKHALHLLFAASDSAPLLTMLLPEAAMVALGVLLGAKPEAVTGWQRQKG